MQCGCNQINCLAIKDVLFLSAHKIMWFENISPILGVLFDEQRKLMKLQRHVIGMAGHGASDSFLPLRSFESHVPL